MVRADKRDSLIVVSNSVNSTIDLSIIVRFQSPEFTGKQINETGISDKERKKRIKAVCVQDAVFSHFSSVFGTQFNTRHNLGEVDIVSVTVVNNDVSVRLAEVFVQVSLTRDNTTFNRPGIVLVSGYVSDAVALSYPSFPGVGWGNKDKSLFGFNTAAPSVSQALFFTIPINSRVDVWSVYATLTTSSNAGNRSVFLSYNDAIDGQRYEIAAPYTQGPSEAVSYLFGPGLASVGIFGGRVSQGMPATITGGSQSLLLKATGMLTGDQWSSGDLNGSFYSARGINA